MDASVLLTDMQTTGEDSAVLAAERVITTIRPLVDEIPPCDLGPSRASYKGFRLDARE